VVRETSAFFLKQGLEPSTLTLTHFCQLSELRGHISRQLVKGQVDSICYARRSSSDVSVSICSQAEQAVVCLTVIHSLTAQIHKEPEFGRNFSGHVIVGQRKCSCG